MSDPRDNRDPDAPPTPEEIAAAARLREALDDPRLASEAAELARALSLSHAPRAIEPGEHRRIVEVALARGDARAKARVRSRRLAYVGAGALSLAAALALVVGGMARQDGAPTAAAPAWPLLPVRSTQPLFREPFARLGGESARIDRIASARASDLRDNRFAQWGVR